jgi:hypothetical protein
LPKLLGRFSQFQWKFNLGQVSFQMTFSWKVGSSMVSCVATIRVLHVVTFGTSLLKNWGWTKCHRIL